MAVEYLGPLEDSETKTPTVEFLGPLEEPTKARTLGLTPISAVTDIPKAQIKSLSAEIKKVPTWMLKQVVGGVEATLGLASGALLWPFAKAYGLAALPFGREAAQLAEESISQLAFQPFQVCRLLILSLLELFLFLLLQPLHMLSSCFRKDK